MKSSGSTGASFGSRRRRLDNWCWGAERSICTNFANDWAATVERLDPWWGGRYRYYQCIPWPPQYWLVGELTEYLRRIDGSLHIR